MGEIYTDEGTELRDAETILGTPRVGETVILEWRKHVATGRIVGFHTSDTKYGVKLIIEEPKRSVNGDCWFYPEDGQVREYSRAIGGDVICASNVVMREDTDQDSRPEPILYNAEQTIENAKDAYSTGKISMLEFENRIEEALLQLEDSGLFPVDAPIDI